MAFRGWVLAVVEALRHSLNLPSSDLAKKSVLRVSIHKCFICKKQIRKDRQTEKIRKDIKRYQKDTNRCNDIA